MATDYYWEDIDQAQQRLNSTVVVYEGRPVYISSVIGVAEDTTPRALITFLPNQIGDRKHETRKKLNSPHFNKFKEIPPLGFLNYFPEEHGYSNCHLLTRVTTRVGSQGLSDRNTSLETMNRGHWQRSGLSLTSIISDSSFLDLFENNYPSFEECFDNLTPNSSVAVSRLYCLFNDEHKLTWLYRNKERIALCVSKTSVFLLPDKVHFREELQESKVFNSEYVKEL